MNADKRLGTVSHVDGGDAAYTYRFSENTSVTLDLIRALSAQMVVVGHGISLLNIVTWLHEPNFPSMQNIAVLIFFLLSGLLITHSTLIKKTRNDYNFKIFFIERFSRIYSGYFPAMCLVVLIDILFQSTYGKESFPYTLGVTVFLGNLLMLQDFPVYLPQFALTSLGSARPFWTLAVEWWIYMFFGWVVLGKTVARRNVVYIPILLLAMVVPCFNSDVTGRSNGLFVVWIMGLAAAFLLNGSSRALAPRTCALFSTILFGCGLLRAYMVESAYDLIFAAILMASLYFLMHCLDSIGPVYHPLAKRIIRLSADYSFSLYLVHYSIYFLLVPQIGRGVSPYLLFAVGFISSNVVALALALCTEMRYRQLSSYLIKAWK